MDDTLPPRAPEKQCTGECKRWLPATPDYFYRRRNRLQSQCKECRSAYQSRNREHRQDRNKALMSVPENLARRHEQQKAYRDNPETHEHLLVRRRASYYRPSVVERRKEYYKRPEVRARKQANTKMRYHDPVIGSHVRAQKRVRTLKYFARKKAISGTYTLEQIQDQLKRQKHRCYYCSTTFEKKNGTHVYHIDHTFPLSRVADTDIPANDISYLVLACPSCNLSKNNRFPWEFPEGGKLL
jgi:hypothetical protein